MYDAPRTLCLQGLRAGVTAALAGSFHTLHAGGVVTLDPYIGQKQRYLIRNWRDYNRALVQPG